MHNHTATAEPLLYHGQMGPAHSGRIFDHFEHDTAEICEPAVIFFGFENFSGISASDAGCNKSKSDFDLLADEWESETQHLSSVVAIQSHKAYQAIRSMGRKAIPWILERLRPDGSSWFYLLNEIAPNPPKIDRGNVRQIILAWKKWGRDNGYRS